MIEVMNETSQMLPDLNHWESTGEALTSDTAKFFFELFPDKTVSMDTKYILDITSYAYYIDFNYYFSSLCLEKIVQYLWWN